MVGPSMSGVGVIVVTQYVGALRRMVRTCRAAGIEPVLAACARTPLGRGGSLGELSGQARAVVSAAPRGLPVLVVESGTVLPAVLGGVGADLLLVRGFPWRIPDAAWESCRLGGVNLHPSALPRDRGPFPVHHALLRGDTSITVTAHFLDAEFDAGPVLARASAPVGDLQSGAEVWSAIDNAADMVLGRALQAVLAGEGGEPQDEQAATWAGGLPADAFRLSNEDSVRSAYNKVRAASLGGAGSRPAHLIDERGVLEVVSCSLVPTDLGVPLICADGTLWLETPQPNSKPRERV